MTQAEGYPPSTTFDNTPFHSVHAHLFHQLGRGIPFRLLGDDDRRDLAVHLHVLAEKNNIAGDRSSLRYPPDAFSCAFSLTLTTMALYHRSLGRFEACSCKPAPRELLSSLTQYCLPAFVLH